MRVLVALGFGALSGCASLPNVVPGESSDPSGRAIPELYADVSSDAARGARCEAIAAELEALGGVPTDAGPKPPLTVAQRVGAYGKGLATETALGVIQPVLQTKRAVFNDAERELATIEAAERAGKRRAYLLGLYDGESCSKTSEDEPVDETVASGESITLVSDKSNEPATEATEDAAASNAAIRPSRPYSLENPPPGWREK